jgi:hypothetical protein
LHIRTSAALCLVLCALVAPTAHAQMKWTDKGFANISIGGQAGSHDVATNTSFDLYDEQAKVATTQKVGGGALFDINAGYKVWRNLVAAVGYSIVSSSADAAVAATIPDPQVFDRPRAVTASASDLNHTENAINLMGVWMVPVTDKIDVGVNFGPTIFIVSQDLPSTISVSEPGPTVTNLATDSVNKTTAGINLGVDVTYLVKKRLGARAGGLVAY